MSSYQFEQVDDLGRILFCDDPALQLECVLGGLETAEGTITLHPAQTPRLPTALFEFRQARGVGYFGYVPPKGASLDEIPEEPQLEGAILFGMRRHRPKSSASCPRSPDGSCTRYPMNSQNWRSATETPTPGWNCGRPTGRSTPGPGSRTTPSGQPPPCVTATSCACAAWNWGSADCTR